MAIRTKAVVYSGRRPQRSDAMPTGIAMMTVMISSMTVRLPVKLPCTSAGMLRCSCSRYGNRMPTAVTSTIVLMLE